MPHNFKKIAIYALIIILVFAAAYFSYAWGKRTWPFGEPKYQVVQLTSGEVYYGKLSFFPKPRLADAYFVQRTQTEEEQTSGVQLVPLNSIFFAPENVMHLNKDQILWWADLSPDSQILKTIKEMRK